ncbi:MAG TPA: hypothetical protein VJ785_03720 [Anaerolineales bacterium]|nr:hypothetical protein [Anaerolineales bacterium]
MKRYFCISAILIGVLLLATPAQADGNSLNFVSAATGVDNGPQDGVFDSFTTLNLGSVNNNGFTSFRTAFEFSLSSFPPGSVITSARLTLLLSNFEGTRAIEVHGYAGDGSVQLSDFALNGRVATASVGPGGTQTLNIDVTPFVAELVENGRTFAGFTVREDPPNTSNFGVMRLEGLPGSPVLSVESSTAQRVDIDIKPGSLPNSINRRSKEKIPVAILSSPTFDAPSQVAATLLTFGRTGDETSLASCSTPKDVNGDALRDLVCLFNIQSTGFQLGDTQGVLKGMLLSGAPITGMDSVLISSK